MNMEEMQKQQDRKNKNFILTKLIPFFVFLILAVSLILAVIYEKTHLNRLSQRLTDAGQKEIIIGTKNFSFTGRKGTDSKTICDRQ